MFPEASVTVPSKSLMSPSATTECPCCRASAINFARRRKRRRERKRKRRRERKSKRRRETKSKRKEKRRLAWRLLLVRVLICISSLLSLPSSDPFSSLLPLTHVPARLLFFSFFSSPPSAYIFYDGSLGLPLDAADRIIREGQEMHPKYLSHQKRREEKRGGEKRGERRKGKGKRGGGEGEKEG